MKFVVNCVSELKDVSISILDVIGNRNIICFYGDLGAGKTTLIKDICKHLGVLDIVSSPTFSIVNEYIWTNDKMIYHFDFFRIETIDEVFDLGYEEYFYMDSLCLIEWPDRIQSLIPSEALRINISKINETREIEILDL